MPSADAFFWACIIAGGFLMLLGVAGAITELISRYLDRGRPDDF